MTSVITKQKGRGPREEQYSLIFALMFSVWKLFLCCFKNEDTNELEILMDNNGAIEKLQKKKLTKYVNLYC